MRNLILLLLFAQFTFGQTLTVSGTSYEITGSELLTITNSWTEGFNAGNVIQGRTGFGECNSGIWELDTPIETGLGLYWEITPTSAVAWHGRFDTEADVGLWDIPLDPSITIINTCSRWLHDDGEESWGLERINANRIRISITSTADGITTTSSTYMNRTTYQELRRYINP